MFRTLSARGFVACLLALGPAQAQSLVPAQSQVPAQPSAVAAAAPQGVGAIPRAERARARQECLSDNIALSGEDLRLAMRDCLQAKFPHVQLYARDGVMPDGRPTVAAARAACKAEADGKRLAGPERRAALIACFNEKRPDIAERASCRSDVRQQGLEGEMLRKALEACGREGRS